MKLQGTVRAARAKLKLFQLRQDLVLKNTSQTMIIFIHKISGLKRLRKHSLLKDRCLVLQICLTTMEVPALNAHFQISIIQHLLNVKFVKMKA